MIYLNSTPINVTMFPDKTSQVWKLPEFTLKESNWAHITWDFENEGEFMHLAQLENLLNCNNIKATLTLKYLPYGRQDKQISNDSTFALRTFAELLNMLAFVEVVIEDPHSYMALDIIKNSREIFPTEELDKVMKLTVSDYVCYPDRGALTKYSSIYRYAYSYGEKVRDQATGNITSYQLFDVPYGKKILIVDDICDGGMTFKILANALLEEGAKEVNLFVTHGIFSKGLKPLYDSGIKQVFTKDGEVSEYNNKLTYRRL